MRIAFISTILDYPWGGADTLWTHAAQAAGARGDSLLVAVTQAVAHNESVSALNAQFHYRSRPALKRTIAARLARRLRLLFRTEDGLVEALAHFRPELMVFSLGGTYDILAMPAWCGWLAGCRIPFRLIANCQDEHPRLTDPDLALARSLYPRAERIYFVSNRNLEVTREHLMLPLKNAVVVQNPLRWRPADRSPWPDEATFSLAVVARLEPIKGIHLLLPALAEALKSAEGWRVQIYGRGPGDTDLRRQASDLGLGPRVVFRGYVGELRSIWADSHMLVSPAVEDGVPMTIPEAMLCGRPVLATSVGGATDWIKPGSNGFICPEASVVALAGALRTAWDSRLKWREMGERAALDAAARYRPEDYRQLILPAD